MNILVYSSSHEKTLQLRRRIPLPSASSHVSLSGASQGHVEGLKPVNGLFAAYQALYRLRFQLHAVKQYQ